MRYTPNDDRDMLIGFIAWTVIVLLIGSVFGYAVAWFVK